MTVQAGFDAFAAQIATALTTAQFIPSAAHLALDDAGGLEPTGEESELQTWAGLSRGQSRPVRTLLGRSSPRYVVEHRAVLDIAWAGPADSAGPARLTAALAAVAQIVVTNPTLGGAVERAFLETVEDEPLAPNGWRSALICAFRIRSGDPLGLTP